MNKKINYFEKLKIPNTDLSVDKYKLQNIYLDNAKADAIFCYKKISKYLKNDHKILEVGGGIHLLTSYLKDKNFDITSIEPGGFSDYIDRLRNDFLNKMNSKIYTTTLEKYHTNDRFDFIISMNVLEHTGDIKKHIQSSIKLLRDHNSLLFIQCPNYNFPFEPHFYKWFIPLFPQFTFKYLRKKSLIKALGKKRYSNILDHLNFNCTYSNIKKLNLNVKFINPLADIFERLDNDEVFKKRLFENLIIKFSYKAINIFRLRNLLIKLFPTFLSPYLIMEIRKGH